MAPLGRHLIAIREDYHGYVAPKWVRRTVERLLSSVPESHLAGLSAIVLTDLPHARGVRRARRNRGGRAMGRYYQSSRHEPAWIEILVNEIIDDLPKPLHRLQVVRDLTLGRVLFHEIGHHLHVTHRGIGASGEPGAEAWQARLSRIHLQRRYGYLSPITPLLKLLRKLASTLSRR
jgi:hypothetical protein